MADPARVALYGTGRTGCAIVPTCMAAGHAVVAAVVHEPEKVGADLGELTLGRTLGIPVTDDLEGVLDRADVDVVLYAGITGEVLGHVLDRCTAVGKDVITASTIDPSTTLGVERATRIDDQARRSGARVLGTGVNPGFFLDVLPAALATTLPDPVRIHARRVTDIGRWGTHVLRSEVGVGRAPADAPETFLGTLEESLHVLARAGGWAPERVERRPDPIVATARRAVGDAVAEAGQVEGINHSVRAITGGEVAIELVWCGVGDPLERGLTPGVDIHLEGARGLQVAVHVEVPADPYPGTAARMIKAIGALRALAPGVYRPTELPLGARACLR